MSGNFIDEIVKELRNSVNCREALACYRRMGVTPHRVTEKGTTDFDRPHGGEDGFYKVEAYIHQYLDMHYQRNFAVLQKCKFLNIEKPCLFIDFGCGPMTSGLALIRRLGQAHAREEVAYWGIDTSQRMLEKAGKINGYFRLFSDAKFSASIGGKDAAYGKMTIKNDFANNCIVVFNFSYVLSQMTLKGNDPVRAILNAVAKISNYALEQNCLVYLIYQNPNVGVTKAGAMHNNWKNISQQLTEKFAIVDEDTSVCKYVYADGRRKETFYAKVRIGLKSPKPAGTGK